MSDPSATFLGDVENIPTSIHNLIPLATSGYKHWYKRYTATGILLEGEAELTKAHEMMKEGFKTTLTAQESKEFDIKFNKLMAKRAGVRTKGKKKEDCKEFFKAAREFGFLVKSSSDFGDRRNHSRRVHAANGRAESEDFDQGDTCTDPSCGLSHVRMHLPCIEEEGKEPVPGYLFVEDRPELDTIKAPNPFSDSRAAISESPLASSSKPSPFKPLVLKGKSTTA